MAPQKQPVPSFASKFVEADVRKRLKHIVAPHVESFDYFIDYGLDEAVADIMPTEIAIDDIHAIKIQYLNCELGYPLRPNSSEPIPRTPKEARESGSSYCAALFANVEVTVEGPLSGTFVIAAKMGELPIMVMSNRCHLKNCSPKKLTELKEEANEAGGFFILNGIERVIRLLQVQRRNYPLAIERSSYKNRGSNYSDKGVSMRCTRPDQSSVTITLHYLTNGGATLKFVLKKQEFLLPVVLVAKSLMDISDQELFNRIVNGDSENTFLTTRLELLLRDFKSYKLYSMAQCQAFLGSLFRTKLPISTKTTDTLAGIILLKRYLFVHVDSFSEKLDCLIVMIRKLFCFAQGKCLGDNADALMNHEILLPGHLINLYVKEKMEESLLTMRIGLLKDAKINRKKFETDITNNKYFTKLLDRSLGGIGAKIGSFLSTGNLITSTGMDLMQVSGYTIVGERLNYLRFLSHFQSVHRGQFFTTMKTTTVRKLLPESWGFLCPVHTPDGSPCGLLNHLAKEAVVLSHPPYKKLPITPNHPILQPTCESLSLDTICSKTYLQEVLCGLGMKSGGIGNGDGQSILDSNFLCVLIDGKYVGGIKRDEAYKFVQQLRKMKSLSHYGLNSSSYSLPYVIEPTTEIAYFPHNENIAGPFPGIFIFTEPGRIIRPVQNLSTKHIEWIGPLEQTFLEIACLKDDIRHDPHPTTKFHYNFSTTHMELSPTVMLSQIASLTPFSDYNQSPRNMYQCQMGKQTMGTPVHAFRHRVDNKLYRIQNVQSPLVQTKSQRDYSIDEYPQGCNAVVAVISYTGYDMEDAMIINKSSYERGFGHGSVYKTHFYDLNDEEKRLSKPNEPTPILRFSNLKMNSVSGTMMISESGELICEDLDTDGLPLQGVFVRYGDPIICMVDMVTGNHKIITHKDNEGAFIDNVRLVGTSNSNSVGSSVLRRGDCRTVSITLRYNRNPVIGDKFSSRHGQKGTLSVLWPQENMPFSETGIYPDVLINPHAFPSRMTIGMLIESMAGKAGAIHGTFQDATPFTFHEKNRAIDHIGEQLRACGYHYYGSEPLYNGLTGKIMQADMFLGVVFYQRLRHMVSDKSQVRSTGAVTAITRQPVKGRKKHGGIRLGEMERDALLSHGVSFCLQDRLMNCSDNHLAHICGKCGGLLTVYAQPVNNQSGDISSLRFDGPNGGFRTAMQQYCNTCRTADHVRPINLPYVYRYLTNELAGMGIKLSLELKD